MRKSLRLAVSLGLVAPVAWLAGCSDQAAQNRASARKQLNEAIADIETASKGFVPQGQEVASDDGSRVADLRAYQHKVLDQARVKLEAAAQVGDAAQQVSARRLLADAHAASARYLSDQAVSEWAALSARSVSLINQLVAVDRAAAREVAANIDRAPSTAALTKAQADLDARLRDLRTRADALGAQVKEMTAQIDRFTQTGAASRAKAQQLNQQGFTAAGAQRYDLYDQAAEAERAAQRAQAEGQRLNARRDVLQGELAIVTRQIELAEASLETLRTQAASIQKRVEAEGTLSRNAREVRGDTTAKLVAAADAIAKAYDERVEPKFIAAEEAAAKAVEAAKAAVNAAADRRSVQPDLLSRYTTLGYVHAQHAIAAGGLAQTLELLAAQAQRQPAPLMPGQASFAQAAEALRARQREVQSAANTVIADGLALHSDLVGGGDERTAAMLESQHGMLEAYKSRIDASVRGDAGGARPAAVPATGAAPDPRTTPAPDSPDPASTPDVEPESAAPEEAPADAQK